MIKLLRKVFFYEGDITEKQYELSRWGFAIEATCTSAIVSLAAGPYLAGLLSWFGASESYINVVMAFAALGGIVQIIAPTITERMKTSKLLVTCGGGLMRLLYATIMLMPIIIPDKYIALTLASAFFILYNFSANFVTPSYNVWFISCIPKEIRGKYFGMKDAITNVGTSILAYVGGLIVDTYINAGNEAMGYFVLGCMLVVLAVIDTACYMTVSEPRIEKNIEEKVRFKDIITKPFLDKKFRKVIFIYIIYSFAMGIANPLFAIYKVSRAHMSFELIASTACVGAAIRVFVSILWGRLSSKTSWYVSLKFALFALAVSVVMWIFITKENAYWMAWVEVLIANFGWGSIGLALYGFQFDNIPGRQQTIYTSCNGAISSVVSFLVGLISSAIIDVTQGASVNFGGFVVCDMQFMFAFSTVLLLSMSWYVAKLEKKHTEVR